MLNLPLAVGGARLTRRLSTLPKGQSALKTAYQTIDCVYTSRRFLNAPISLDFKHTLSAGRPKISENYHINHYKSATNGDTTCEIMIGIKNRKFYFVIDRTFIEKSKLNLQESGVFILNRSIADIIKENKAILYAELMQWANRANFGEVR